MPISKVEEILGKMNNAISSLGYMDCGYKVLTILPEKESKFNYVILANWKNQETYKIIHESDLFNKAIEGSTKDLTDMFKDEIYVKASFPE